MPLLLEDLVEETSVSNQRTADRFDAETRELERLKGMLSALEDLRERIVESARQATDHVISKLPQAEGVWRSALAVLPTRSKDQCVRLLQQLLRTFETGQRLVRSPREMWNLAGQLKVRPERLDELEKVEQRFTELASEAKLALDHRTKGWQPADPDRLVLGLQLAQAGQAVKSEEAKARFRRAKS